MQIIDSLLNSLCTLTDGIIANSLASTTGATGEPNWDKFGEEVSSKVQSIGLQVLSSPSVSKFTKCLYAINTLVSKENILELSCYSRKKIV